MGGVPSEKSKHILHRITNVERKVFQTIKTGGLDSRIFALYYVDGKNNGTWSEWLDGFEKLLLNNKRDGSTIERIEYLELKLEGQVLDGNLRDRLLAMNQMPRTVLCG